METTVDCAEFGGISPARVKMEPETDQSEIAPVKEEAVFLDEEERVKEEWSDSAAGRGVSEAAMLADLYIEHEVKDELVLGPERPHRPVVAPAALYNRVAASALVSPAAVSGVRRSCSVRHAFSCGQCDYKCRIKKYLTVHLRTHTDEKSFSCTHCGYKSRRQLHLKYHLMTHTDEKPLSCSYCDYKCKIKQTLRRHLMTHTDERPFSCGHCAYKSRRKESLRFHLMTHTGDKPFSCSHCWYKCRSKAQLRVHQGVHFLESQGSS